MNPALRAAGCVALLLPVLAAGEQTAPEESYLVIDGKVDRSTYTGWQIYSENCSRCHGADATGTTVAPDLTERVNRLSQDQFRLRVLNRYFLTLPLEDAIAEGSHAVAEAMEEAAQARAGSPDTDVDMPRWHVNPDVRHHIVELYAYLTARADGVLGPGIPDLLPE
jgi:mono/diheme cytochrome c family protein